VGSSVIVLPEKGWQLAGPLAGGPDIGPLTDQGLDEALGLSGIGIIKGLFDWTGKYQRPRDFRGQGMVRYELEILRASLGSELHV